MQRAKPSLECILKFKISISIIFGGMFRIKRHFFLFPTRYVINLHFVLAQVENILDPFKLKILRIVRPEC